MRCDSMVTLWHYDSDSGEYLSCTYPAKVFFEDRLAKSGVKQKGYYSGSRATVRIPKSHLPMAWLGDYIRQGEASDASPDRINDLKVTKITENYKGANPHLKLFCGRASERS